MVKDLIQYLSICMPAGRKVSGNTFNQINKMPMNPTFSVPYVAHAVIKANATCSEEECEDGVGKKVSQQDIRNLYASKKDACMSAEGVMQRAASIVRMQYRRDCTVEFWKLPSEGCDEGIGAR